MLSRSKEMSLSEKLNMGNVRFVRQQIAEKINYAIPYYARVNDTTKAVTDLDHHPYGRYFRGVYYDSEPIVFEREAGFRKWEQPCYQPNECQYIEEYYPNHCWEGACSVVFPCDPHYVRKYADKNEMEVMLNRTCVNKSP
jgi:hypothetical protein